MTCAHHPTGDRLRRHWPKTTYLLVVLGIGVIAVSLDYRCYLGARHVWHLPEAVAELLTPACALVMMLSAACQPTDIPDRRRVRLWPLPAFLLPRDMAWHGLRLAAALTLIWSFQVGSAWGYRTGAAVPDPWIQGFPALGMLILAEGAALYRRNARLRAIARDRRAVDEMHDFY